MSGLRDDIGVFFDSMPKIGDIPTGEYVDYTAMPEPEQAKKKTATVGLLSFLPFVLAGLFVFFVLRGKK